MGGAGKQQLHVFDIEHRLEELGRPISVFV